MAAFQNANSSSSQNPNLASPAVRRANLSSLDQALSRLKRLSRLAFANSAFTLVVKTFAWLACGAALAAALFFTGGLAAVPLLNTLGPLAIIVLAPILAAPQALIWKYFFKPLYSYCLQKLKPKAKPAFSLGESPLAQASPSPQSTYQVVDALSTAKNDRDESALSYNESQLAEASWYQAEVLEGLIYAPLPPNLVAAALRVVFLPPSENPGSSFKAQLNQLRLLKTALQAPFACFICFEPSDFATSHFIMGILIQDSLVIINPLGETSHLPFFKHVEQARSKRSEALLISHTVLQRDAKSLLSCGPICVELLRYISTFSPKRLADLLTGTPKVPRSHAELPHYQTFDLSECGLLPPSLLPLLTEKTYAPQVTSLRQQHVGLIIEAQAERGEDYDDERTLMNQLVLKEVNLFNLKDQPAFHRLQRRFAALAAEASEPSPPLMLPLPSNDYAKNSP